MYDVWVEVELSALKHNLTQVKSVVHASTRVMAVIKANGYGHGYIEPAKAFVEGGADYLAVTRIDEAIPMREAGITAPILLFAPIQPENAEPAIAADLDLTVTSLPLAQAISAAAQKLGKTARVWVKIDTGMGRLGVLPNDVPACFDAVRNLPGIIVAGIYTHFSAAAEADITPTRAQLSRFDSVRAGFAVRTVMASAANSAAILRLHESHLDIVRPGTLLYGQYPSQHVPHSLDLKPTWKLKARICDIRDLPKGSKIGYGSEYACPRPTRTAIVPIGFADGFTLLPEGPVCRQSLLKFAARKLNRGLSMQVRDKRAPVLGRVAMQMTVLDVTEIPEAQVGDEVIVPAMRIPTNPLIPRVYLDPA